MMRSKPKQPADAPGYLRMKHARETWARVYNAVYEKSGDPDVAAMAARAAADRIARPNVSGRKPKQ
jgi:hypothetical protein